MVTMDIVGLESASGFSGTKLQDFVQAAYFVLKKYNRENPKEQELIWQDLCKNLFALKEFSDLKFEAQKLLFDFVYGKRLTQDGPPPAWFPSKENLEKSNLAVVMKDLDFKMAGNRSKMIEIDPSQLIRDQSRPFREFHKWSVENTDDFWSLVTKRLGIVFKKSSQRISDLSNGAEKPVWFPGSEINIVDSCFNADKGKIAVYFSREGSGKIQSWTYGDLENLVNQVANSLKEKGYENGDVIAIDMQMTPESVAVYLGVIKAGCVALSIADCFAPPEIEKRLKIGNAKLIFTVDYYMRDGKKIEIYNKVKEANPPPIILIPYDETSQEKLDVLDIYWKDFLVVKDEFESVACRPQEPTNILFSSGTTGEPKAIPWDHTTPIKAASDSFFHQDIHPDDILAWPTNLGWMMGPWLIYATLVNKASMALYTGSYSGKEFGEFVQNTGVTMLGVIPSLVNIWKTKKCMEDLDWSKIKRFSSTGECSRKEDMLYLMSLAGYKPIIEYCGGTEIGGVYITGTMIQPCSPSTFTTAAMGVDFLILDESGKRTKNGEVFIIPPSIGLSTLILNRDNFQTYYEGCPKENGYHLRRHGDQVEELANNYFVVHGRTDDTMNLSGVKVSSAEIERTLHGHPGISETAAIGIMPADTRITQLIVYAVPSNGSVLNKEKIKSDFQQAIKTKLNPIYKIHDVVITNSLPRTASNKVMRRLLRDEYQKNIQAR